MSIDREEPTELPAETTPGLPPAPVEVHAPRPTRTYLTELLASQGLRPQKQFGQNFLIDLNLLDLIADSANLSRSDVVLEVGPGTGGLTNRLCDRAGFVVAVEIDTGFYRLAKQETFHRRNLELIQGDALQSKNKLNPVVREALGNALATLGSKSLHLVSNLPYDVATSVIGNLLLDDLPVRSLVMTIQYEMGERLMARPGVKDYGPISALVQRVGNPSWVRTLRPEVFWPRPKVMSAIVKVTVDAGRREPLPELREWYRFVRPLFLHRRKSLRAAVVSVPGYKQLRPHIDAALAEAGLAAAERAEDMTHRQLTALYEALKKVAAEHGLVLPHGADMPEAEELDPTPEG